MKFLIALLTAATGILHLLVGFGMLGGGPTNWLLVLNGVGYLVLLLLFWRASGNCGTMHSPSTSPGSVTKVVVSVWLSAGSV